MVKHDLNNSTNIKQYNHRGAIIAILPIEIFVGKQMTGKKHRLTQKEFDRFATLSGDNNPIHVDPSFVSRTRFKRTVCHGMLLYSMICGFLSRLFHGSSQIEQNLMFPAPAFAGDEIVISAEVASIDTKQHRLQLIISIKKKDDQIVCKGKTKLDWSML